METNARLAKPVPDNWRGHWGVYIAAGFLRGKLVPNYAKCLGWFWQKKNAELKAYNTRATSSLMCVVEQL